MKTKQHKRKVQKSWKMELGKMEHSRAMSLASPQIHRTFSEDLASNRISMDVLPTALHFFFVSSDNEEAHYLATVQCSRARETTITFSRFSVVFKQVNKKCSRLGS